MNMPRFGANFLGRLAKIKVPKSRPLLPIFECILNSIDSIEKFGIGDTVKIKVIRDKQEQPLVDDKAVNEIIGFEITDNGVGLNDLNFRSFCELDTTFKKDVGGKGIGRLTWLKTFNHVEIDSIYEDYGKCFRRHLVLHEQEDPFKVYSNEKIENTQLKTKIILNKYKDEYKKHLTKSLLPIVDKTVSHFMPRMFSPDIIKIVIDDEESIDLRSFFQMHYREKTEPNEFFLENYRFEINILPTLSSMDNSNKVYFCARKRTVESLNAEMLCKYLSAANKYIAVYVSSEYLDENVLDDRFAFDLKDEPREMLDQPIGWSGIKSKVREMVNDYSKEAFKDIIVNHKQSVDSYVQNKNPRYRKLLKDHPEIVDKIPLNPSNDDIVSVLEVENQKRRVENRNSIRTVLSNTSIDIQTKKQEIFDYVKNNYQLSQDILADYMVERRAILDLLKEVIRKAADNSISLESDVHNIIFPMGETSDLINYDEHNLWLIDERLSFHRLLTSDISIRANFDNESRKEPDILCYIDEPITKFNNFSSAIIVEFKRPIRPSKHKNPIEQVTDIVYDLIHGNTEVSGRKIRFNDNSHFYGYIVTDIDSDIERWIFKGGLFVPSPDGGGYFGYHKDLNLYLEIITYDKLINDAEKRNQILFHKLGLT